MVAHPTPMVEFLRGAGPARGLEPAWIHRGHNSFLSLFPEYHAHHGQRRDRYRLFQRAGRLRLCASEFPGTRQAVSAHPEHVDGAVCRGDDSAIHPVAELELARYLLATH